MKKQLPGFSTLHPTQERLLDLLAKENNNESLSLREMASRIGVNSPNTVEHHLLQLEKKGYIFRDKDTGKIEAMKNPAADIMYLNLYGCAKCGPEGLITEDNIVERIPLPVKRLRIKPNSFLVKAEGDSMEPMIYSGDIVVAEKTNQAVSGSVMIVVHEDAPKIKKLFIDSQNQTMILQSINSKVDPIFVNDAEQTHVEGVVRGVIRNKLEKTITA